MAHPFFARFLLTGIALTQALATLRIDLHRSHATNPLWLPHARFHLVWQVLNLTLLSLVEVVLVWWPGRYAPGAFYLAVWLITMTLVAFWAALASRRLYGGALFDQNGIPPLRVKLQGRIFLVEMNTVAVSLGSIVMLIAVALYR